MVIDLIITLSTLRLKIFQSIWFCIEWADPFWRFSSGMCSIFLSNKRQLLTFVRCSSDNFTFCSTSTFFFRKSTKAFEVWSSAKAVFVEVSKLLISKIVCRPKSVFEMRSTLSKHSTGIVKLTRIFIISSTVVSSLACISKGIMYFFMFWPKLILLRYVRTNLSSSKILWRIDSRAAGITKNSP